METEISATKLNKDDGDVQVSALIYAMGREAEQVFSSFRFAEERDKANFDIVIGKFDTHFVPHTNIIHERSICNISTQNSGESMEAFVRSLYDLPQNCDYGAGKEDMIRDRPVVGLLDKEISTELQLTMDLTLDGAIQKARHSELVKGQVSNQKGGVVEEIKHPKENYHYSTQFRGRSHGRTSHGQYRGHGRGYNTQHAHRGARGGAYGGQGPQPTDLKCNKCGKPAHSNWRNCPARQDECHSCQRVGHWSKFCPSVDELTEDMSSQFF